MFLSAISFGQNLADQLETRKDSIFNRVAADLKLDMRCYWKPDSWFLSRRTMSQLGDILMESGLSRLYGNGKAYKKSDLVPMMLRYFDKVQNMKEPEPDHLKALGWLPQAMNFPAIYPDTVCPPAQAKDELAQAA